MIRSVFTTLCSIKTNDKARITSAQNCSSKRCKKLHPIQTFVTNKISPLYMQGALLLSWIVNIGNNNPAATLHCVKLAYKYWLVQTPLCSAQIYHFHPLFPPCFLFNFISLNLFFAGTI